MAVSKIDDIYLYTGWTSSAQECYRIIEWLKNNNVKYTLLQYNDEAQYESVFSSLNTWFQGVTFTDFPVLVYTNMDLDVSPSQWTRGYFTNLADIQADSNFLSLSRKNS